jgi:amidase
MNDATALAAMVARGDASPVELVDAAITRIEKLNPELNAVIHPRFEAARAEAAGDLPGGPFRGVPFLLKDLHAHSAGDPSHDGMRALRDTDRHAEQDTVLVARLRAAGVVFLGRTNTPELGLLPTTEPEAHGPTRNPWDPSRTPGGSSGGSAAAVAAGMVPAAQGSDGGGSIRIPASCCGLVGLKPSRGRSTLAPLRNQFTTPFSVEGFLTHTVRDTAALLDVVRGPSPGDAVIAPEPRRPYRQEVGTDPGHLRVGMLTHRPDGTPVEPEVEAAVRDAADLLASLGHHVEEQYPPEWGDAELGTHFFILWTVGAARSLARVGSSLGRTLTADDVEVLTWAQAELGRVFDAAQLLDAYAQVERFSRAVGTWFTDGGGQHDLLVSPTLAEPPPQLGEFVSTTEDPMGASRRAGRFSPFTPAWNVAGLPAISLPIHESPEGLPIGTQIVAAYGREDLLVQVASQLETVRPWAGRQPAVHAIGDS